MKRIIPLLLLVSIVLLSGCNDTPKTSLDTKQTEVFLNTDPIVSSRKDSPKSIPMIVKSGDNNILARILIAEGREVKPTIIFLHGNPGFEKNEETGQILRRAGYNTVFFSYSGTWGNKGFFGYNKSLEDVKSVIDYLCDNAKSLRVNSEQIYLCGFSMGADIAILSTQYSSNIKGIISIDPWNGFNALQQKSKKELQRYSNNLEIRPCINIASGKAFVDEIINSEKMNLTTALNGYSNSMIHIFSKKKDMLEFKKYCENLKEQKMILLNAVDHSFSDKRISLARTIYNWLEVQK
jgi:alpha/beta superfamily hydrolase